MKKFRHSKKGLSLPFSILFLLVVVMLCMVLVTAAVITVSHVQKEKQERQATLTVTSAAQTLAAAIEASTVKVTTAGGTAAAQGTGDMGAFLAAYAGSGTADPVSLVLAADSTQYASVTAQLSVKSAADPDTPCDVLVSLNLTDNPSADYNVTFRVDGSYDAATATYSWSGVTYYSGSEVY